MRRAAHGKRSANATVNGLTAACGSGWFLCLPLRTDLYQRDTAK